MPGASSITTALGRACGCATLAVPDSHPVTAATATRAALVTLGMGWVRVLELLSSDGFVMYDAYDVYLCEVILQRLCTAAYVVSLYLRRQDTGSATRECTALPSGGSDQFITGLQQLFTEWTTLPEGWPAEQSDDQ